MLIVGSNPATRMKGDNMRELVERYYEEFLKSKLCDNCGSQRCDKSIDWAEGCDKCKAFIDMYHKANGYKYN